MSDHESYSDPDSQPALINEQQQQQYANQPASPSLDDSNSVSPVDQYEPQQQQPDFDSSQESDNSAYESGPNQPASPGGVEPASPGGVEPASPDGVEPASPGGVEPASPDEVEPAPPDGVEPASPDGVEPASPDGVEPASPDEVEPAPPDGVEPASPDGVEPASPDGVEPASPDGVEPASPDGVEPASPDGVEPAIESVITDPVAKNSAEIEALAQANEVDVQISRAEEADSAVVESIVEICNNVATVEAVITDESEPQEPAQSNEIIIGQSAGEPSRKRHRSDDDADKVEEEDEEGDDESDFEGFEPPEAKHPRRHRSAVLDDDDEDKKDAEQVDIESGQQQQATGIINDIFGDSDQEEKDEEDGDNAAEEEEFEGFNPAEADDQEEGADADRGDASKSSKKQRRDSSSSSSSGDEGVDGDEEQPAGFPVSDFDAIMQRKKEERRNSRKRRSTAKSEFLTDADSVITHVVYEMREAAQSDRELMENGRPATKKMKMLPKVVSLLTKADVVSSLSDSAILSAITEWLAPCPDGSLPSLQIRETLLRMLETIPGIDSDGLASSGLGKAVMYLYKHKRESRPNKTICGRLINAWSRPIFQLTDNYSTLTKEEREERDYANIPQYKRATDARSSGRGDDQRKAKPGEPGYVARARVPMPSNKDYVVRPKPRVDVDAVRLASSAPKKRERQVWFERHVRQLKDKSRNSKSVKKAVAMSIEGRKMAL